MRTSGAVSEDGPEPKVDVGIQINSNARLCRPQSMCDRQYPCFLKRTMFNVNIPVSVEKVHSIFIGSILIAEIDGTCCDCAQHRVLVFL
jgi:hypothetical protein